MNDKQIFPFERNRYYVGKMLTSADFQAEQNYFNNKRRFVNNLMFGKGIVCGCSVFSLDDLSLLVESGVAVDGWGREIVIEKAVVKKLSAVEGFDKLESNYASLCLRYKEENVHSVYAIHKQNEEEYEHNRIAEGYELYLVDTAGIEKEFKLESEFLTKGNLLKEEDYQIEIHMPATVCQGKYVKIIITVEKLTGEEVELNYNAVLQVPAFTTEDGKHEITIEFKNLLMKEKEKIQKEYWLKVQDIENKDSNIILRSGTCSAKVGEQKVQLQNDFSMKVVVEDIAPRELVNREIGKMSLEIKNMNEEQGFIRLADLRLLRTESAYIIEDIIEKNVKRYIQTPAEEITRNEYLEYFSKYGKDISFWKNKAGQESGEPKDPKAPGNAPNIATGILEIPLGDRTRVGDTRYSGEILHGLGNGNVYVEIGHEFLEEDRVHGANAKSTVYGNQKLFKRNSKGGASVETAIKVLNDKGSFIVAARLNESVSYLVLTYRWMAIKLTNGNENALLEDYTDKRIVAETQTVILGTKESYYFNVKHYNMEQCSIAYELTESGSGEITSDGIYTAPNKEGVFEIRIYCTDMPIICTYAYAIVKKKGLEKVE